MLVKHHEIYGEKTMKNILIGIMDSSVGGVNRFILDYIYLNKNAYNFFILATSQLNAIYFSEIQNDWVIETIPSIKCPVKLYECSKEIIHKYKIDSLYLNISTNLFYPVLQAAADCDVKERVVHSHSSYSANGNFFKRNLIVVLNILLQKKVNGLATKRKACSDKAAYWLFGKKAEYDFIYNKVNGQKFFFDVGKRQKCRKELGLENFLIIGFVGGFNYPKNIFYFLDIARKLKKIRKDFCIVMLGDGELKCAFEIKLKKYNLESCFRLLGNRANVNEYYNMFDCFVMPSRFEGLPIVGIEAQVNGLRCFFSDRITRQVLITGEARCFKLNDLKGIVRSLSMLKIANHIITKTKEFENFVIG